MACVNIWYGKEHSLASGAQTTAFILLLLISACEGPHSEPIIGNCQVASKSAPLLSTSVCERVKFK